MPTSVGIAKVLSYKKEVTWGTLPAAAGAQALRRTTSDLSLTKETYQSAEMRTDYQVSDFRHGSRSVEGTINGEISPGTYKDFLAAALRQAWQAGSTTGAAVASVFGFTTSGPNRSSGSFLTDGFKIGDVIRCTGYATASLNTRNFLVTAVAATQLTGAFIDGTANTAETASAGASVTMSATGKKTWVPTTGHTDDSFSIEHFYSDITQSEVFSGCKVSQVEVQLPATGMGTIGIGVMGKDMVTASAQYFTTPTVETTSGLITAVNGALYVNGAAVANVTGMNFTINGNMTSEAVIGSNVRPEIFEGRVMVSGQITAFFDNVTLRDMFKDETEASVIGVFTTSNAANADFMTFVMSRIKVGGNNKDDGEKGIVQTIPFTALLNPNGGAAAANLKTTLSIQDSLA